jgi:4-amino-4-deoxychorismate lyase
MDNGGAPSQEVADSPDFYIFTSYLWANGEEPRGRMTHGNHYYLSLHRDRLLSAAQALGWADAVEFLGEPSGFTRFVDSIEIHIKAQHDTKKTFRKVKVCIYKDLRIHVESATITLVDRENTFPLPADLNEIGSAAHRCIVKLYAEPIIHSAFTMHKTSERTQYDRARKVTAIDHKAPNVAEVLLLNARNEVMECSMSTPYFFRNSRWVTPHLSSGGNAGVTRRLALERGLCEEQAVLATTLRDEEAIWISNGVRGFIPATLSLQSLS